MDPITIINLSAALIKVGYATYEQISETVRANRGELTDDQVNAILDAIASDDDKRAELAANIAAGNA